MNDELTTDSRLAQLIDQYGRLIDSVIGRLMQGRLAHARDDVKQEVVIALWKRLKQSSPIEHPTSYVYQVARREAIRILQREARRSCELSGPVEVAAPDEKGPLHELEGRETGERINRALATLEADRRQAVRAHLMGFDVQEIMRMRGWAHHTARNLVSRGMADLRSQLSSKPSEASK